MRSVIGLSQNAAESGTVAAREGEPDPGRRPRIVVVLPRGETIRNFLYSGMLRQLGVGADVTLISVLPSEKVRTLLEADCQSVYELSPVATRWPVRFLFELAEMAHGRWLWSEAAKERWRLRDAEAETPIAWWKRRLKKVLCFPFANTRGVEILSGIQGAASRWLRTTDEYIRLLQDLRPALVFNGSHVHSDLAAPVIEAAGWLGIPTAAFIFSWDNLTSQGRILPPYDRYLVWNEGLRDQLLRLYPGVNPSSVAITGTPQFDFHFWPEFRVDRHAFCRQIGADLVRPIVLYTTGMANHMPGEPIIVERIADMLNRMTDLGPPQLLVRVYPKDQTGRFDDLARRRPDILIPSIPWEPTHLTPLPEDGVLLTNMLRHAALGINVASTVSLELCMFDKPVINVGYNPPGFGPLAVDYIRYYDYDHYRSLVQSGAVVVARSETELEALVREAFLEPALRRAERSELVRRFFGQTLDGRSADRVAQTLLQLCDREPSGE